MARQKTNLAAARRTSLREVEFIYESAASKDVYLAGDFNHWSTVTHPMQKDGAERWRICVPLAPGRYEYRFIVDGDWQNDPYACGVCLNEFGTCNCVVEVKG